MELLGPLAPVLTEAVKTWGVFSIILLMLGFMLWKSWRESKSRDEEIKLLRSENARLQDLRLQDAREMIRVAETGTATMAARSEGDAQFRNLMSALVSAVTQSRGVIALPPPENR